MWQSRLTKSEARLAEVRSGATVFHHVGCCHSLSPLHCLEVDPSRPQLR